MFSRSNKSGKEKPNPASKIKPLETPFESRRRALAQEEAALKAQAERHRQFIEDAPRLAEEKQKRQREMFLRNASRTDGLGPGGTVKLPDSRFLQAEMAAGSNRTRRKDRQKGKWMFFLLLTALFVVAYWAWMNLAHPAF